MSDLLADFVGIEKFAKDVGRTTRTVLRWMDDNGLPYSRLGSRRFIHMPSARQWLLDRIRQANPERRGRQKSSR
jgi:hypothetical protein